MNAEYAEVAGSNMSFNLLLVGPPKSGKTHLASTGRGPHHWDMFDPGGDKIPSIQKGFREGRMTVKRWTSNMSNIKDPKMVGKMLTTYEAWIDDFDRKVSNGFFNNIGTYVIDSATTLLQRMMFSVTEYSKRKDHIPEWNDYKLARLLMLRIVTVAADLPCDFIMIGHMTMDQDGITGRIRTSLNVFKSLKADIPALFDDYYVTIAKSKSDGMHYEVLTRPEGDYDAGSRLGAGVLKAKEEADLSKIIAKIEAANNE